MFGACVARLHAKQSLDELVHRQDTIAISIHEVEELIHILGQDVQSAQFCLQFRVISNGPFKVLEFQASVLINAVYVAEDLPQALHCLNSFSFQARLLLVLIILSCYHDTLEHNCRNKVKNGEIREDDEGDNTDSNGSSKNLWPHQIHCHIGKALQGDEGKHSEHAPAQRPKCFLNELITFEVSSLANVPQSKDSCHIHSHEEQA
mmetsp:Transcript_3641/g.9219  ORF Transcript_3641/g.9219 Transcript_3641/m.9219 type:complete len:205 (+) Transcript_3641:1484-2098(+)